MARKRDEVIDDDGNVIPPPSPDSPVMAIVWLLEYGRKRGFRIGPRVQVGDTTVEVVDMRQQLQASRAMKGEQQDIAPGSDMDVILNGADPA
jgi:hypothetical protein